MIGCHRFSLTISLSFVESMLSKAVQHAMTFDLFESSSFSYREMPAKRDDSPDSRTSVTFERFGSLDLILRMRT